VIKKGSNTPSTSAPHRSTKPSREDSTPSTPIPGWARIGEGHHTITVEVQVGVAAKHDVPLQDFHPWLNTPGTSPAEITARQRVREIRGTATTLFDRQLRDANKKQALKRGTNPTLFAYR
jgi:hypothetical protein